MSPNVLLHQTGDHGKLASLEFIDSPAAEVWRCIATKMLNEESSRAASTIVRRMECVINTGTTAIIYDLEWSGDAFSEATVRVYSASALGGFTD